MVTSHKKKIRIDKLYEEDFVLWLEEQTRACEGLSGKNRESEPTKFIKQDKG